MAPEEEKTTLTVGVVLTSDPEGSRASLASFCKALSDATGFEVNGLGGWNYNTLLEALETGEVDLAWLPPLVAMRATSRARVMPIVLPVRNGASSYRTALYAPQSSPIREISDLQGLRAAWVDRQSAAGYIVLRAHLRSLGVDLDRAFRENLFFGSHGEVARAVLQGSADVGATFVHVEPDPSHPRGERVVRAGWEAADVHVITCAGPIPADVMAASVRVPVATMRKVQRALVGSGDDELGRAARTLFGAEGFVVALSEHLDPLAKLIAKQESEG
ncbi:MULTISPECIES: phosphate/phosphite/phosphonate ABC transporter substrate-binding protein [Polyangium]|uniref:Phosphate/phosphite/phosphonate ABC transporter substrate-binding protein n=2 Tax=Polyangium TaxID=55 RepID=A0A4U1J5L8_9BACT|nr:MULTISPECIES: phosphate/phosphite/phosphonate ABC transporter substrate-binding protein [Polyangium]MDI1433079.1 phosphate/phosphite/phosphonate ABC transporter substrate-binding protein [Polyangium sorediatum]TKD02043.1 phosphate/phosphite/phosphonate ABC transporter substrate-binding protein [Polyangium fumosum]